MQLNVNQWREKLKSGALDKQLSQLYGESLGNGTEGISETIEGFAKHFDESRPFALLSASGRTELSGNHTDHQHGCVLAAAVTMDMTAAASPREDSVVRVFSHGFGEISVDLSELDVKENEKGSSNALIRGIAAAMNEEGRALRGFDAYIRSNVPQGSGLSSSAAYEVLIGKIFSSLFCEDSFTPTQLAIFGQFAENRFFGKPCGLMDQMASALGGVVFIDFKDPKAPKTQVVDFDFESAGYRLCITNCGGSHADLTGDYAAITTEMRTVSDFFGKTVLREVSESAFYAALPEFRKSVSDRALLRAMHFFDENERVQQQYAALKDGNIKEYLRLMNRSGRSSEMQLQNIWPTNGAGERSLALALQLTERFLKGEGAFRVHGGGFAGTIQAFVPAARAEEYKKTMDSVFGISACCIMAVRAVGAYTIEED